ncbi:MAG TPA: hypothetical protein VFI22_19500, partial [Thermomicrobiales bacterium]|nr:hypothetical protein [Thermomicrobiales bacterium]
MDGPPAPASPSSSTPPPAPESVAATDVQSELERLRQRLRFYEGFDTIIQETTSRAGELLRAAEAERSRAAREAVAAREEAARAAEARRSLLLDLAADMDALARRIRAAIDAGEPDAAPDPPPDAPHETAPMREPPSPLAQGQESLAAAAQAMNGGVASAAAPGSMTVIVHGVPDALAALSLQRHLAALAGGGTVLAREFMAGIARFEVTGTAITFEDLRRWDGGGALRPVHLQPD